jgi:hypothetical protein
VSGLDRRAAIGALVAAVLGVGGYFVLRPTDESRIRKQLSKLATAVRIKESDMQSNPIGRLAHVSGEFEELFDPDVRVSVSELTSLRSGRRELAEIVSGAPRFVRTFEVDFSGVTIKIDEAGASAAVGAIAEVSALDRDGQTRKDKRAVDFRFVKDGSAWIITTVSVWPPGENGQ